MLSKYLSSIEGIAAYPMISLFIFIPFFLAVTYWVFTLDKSFLNYMGNMPLQDTPDHVEDRN